MHPLLKNIVRVGSISSIQPSKCTARVAFEDQENVVSYELPILVRGSLENQDYWMPGLGEQVVCLFLPSGNAQGFILGSFYSEADKPPVTDPNKRHIRFSDGTFIEYNLETHTLTIDVTQSGGEVIINGKFTHNGPTG
jgi:phage baseplate assembly protein V